MREQIKKNRKEIKNILFLICLLVLAFQFRGSFIELTDMIDTNQPYIQVNPSVPNGGQIDLNLENTPFLLGTDNKEQITSYVRTDTLHIYTYKLIQTILLLFGIFMCLIFMAINNHDFSLIELAEEKKQ